MTERVNDNSKPQFGRAFTAALNADWLITEEALRNFLAIASRISPEKAVEAYDAEPLEYTREATVRDGVAIIPVDGPIFRYANLFTYFSGGASVDILAKDFISALENPAVSAIMFEINSPGGEVTGINEFCEMIYAARSKKPITARVGGLGCSAAYWMASACGDIAIDETAMLGSIGVYCCYLDDRRAMTMSGLEEIEFISSQSPYKNSAPWSDQGKARIQKRIDALAAVFVEKVARNRGVSVETVLNNFGQGDVFVGQAAVDAGLADRLGSFEESVYLLNVTHNPYFTPPATPPAGTGEDEDGSSAHSTINKIDAVEFEPVPETGDQRAQTEKETEELMSEKEKIQDPNQAAASAAPSAVTETSPAANAGAAPAPEKTDVKANADVAVLTAELEKSREESHKASERIAVLEKAATDKFIAETVEGFAGDRAAHTEIFAAIVAAHGKDGPVTAKYIELQTATAAQLEAAGLFTEIGKSGAADASNSAEAKVEKLTRDKMSAEKLTYEQAYSNVLEENKELAGEVLNK